MRLAPLGVQASTGERHLGIDFTPEKRASTAVRRTWLEKSKLCVKRIRKIHGRSSVPLRQRLAVIARASLSKANHCVVAVTEPNETELQQFRFQVASCLAKRLHWEKRHKGAHGGRKRLGPSVRFTRARGRAHARVVGHLDAATMAKCVKVAQHEQFDNARPWAAVRGVFGAAVATLKRMQWTVFEHDPLLWCMHDGRVVDPRRTCPQSVHILLRKAAVAWPWRRCMRATSALAVELC